MTPADALERGDAPPSDYERAVEAVVEAIHDATFPDPITNTDDREQARRVLAALRAAGFAVVPREPTRAMMVGAREGWANSIFSPKPTFYGGEAVWSAMLAAGEVKSP